MASLSYYYSKFIKKILRGKSVFKSKIDKTATVNSGCSIFRSIIGRGSYIGYDCEIINTDIGAFCSLASGIHIGLAEHPIDWVSTSPVFQDVVNSSVKIKYAKLPSIPSKRTLIENDVWIGTNVIIKAGVKIGNGAVIASGAVVTKDVAPYAIVGGCPAKLIKYRFEDDLIQRLIASQWWLLEDKDLKRLGKMFDNPEEFLDALNKASSVS